MSLTFSLLQPQKLMHIRASRVQLRGISSYRSIVGTIKLEKRSLSPFVACCHRPSSSSTVNILCNWNHSMSSSLSTSSCLHQRMMAPSVSDFVRTLSNSTTCEQKSPTSTDLETRISFLQKIYNKIQSMYNERHLFLQSLRDLPMELWQVSPVLFTRFIAFWGTFQVTLEYGFKTILCEGPSMEPTIIDGSNSCVLIDRWSHRLFGLENDSYHADEKKEVDSITEEQEQRSHHEERDNRESSWYALLCGVWKQHFSSGLQRGDVVIVHHPAKEATICKRIIGMPGDTIVRTDGGDEESGHRVVPPGRLWIEGDNSLRSLDSRSYGMVPASLVIGKVICRLWPLREYAPLGVDANGMEHWMRVSARIGRGERPLPSNQKEESNGSYVLERRIDDSSCGK